MLLLTSIFVATGLALVGVAIPLIRRRVPPNRWYGVRVAATLADEWVWFEANARSGRDLLLLGILQVGLSLVLPLLDLSPQAYANTVTTVVVPGALLVAGVGIVRANRLLAARRASSPPSSDGRAAGR